MGALEDTHFTPISPRPAFPGVGVHANVIDSILQKKFLSSLESHFRGAGFCILLLLGMLAVAAAWLYGHSRPGNQTGQADTLKVVAALLLLLEIYTGFAFGLFRHEGVWIEMAAPTLFLGASSLLLAAVFYLRCKQMIGKWLMQNFWLQQALVMILLLWTPFPFRELFIVLLFFFLFRYCLKQKPSLLSYLLLAGVTLTLYLLGLVDSVSTDMSQFGKESQVVEFLENFLMKFVN